MRKTGSLSPSWCPKAIQLRLLSQCCALKVTRFCGCVFAEISGNACVNLKSMDLNSHQSRTKVVQGSRTDMSYHGVRIVMRLWYRKSHTSVKGALGWATQQTNANRSRKTWHQMRLQSPPGRTSRTCEQKTRWQASKTGNSCLMLKGNKVLTDLVEWALTGKSGSPSLRP